jgi:hypothetical protein
VKLENNYHKCANRFGVMSYRCSFRDIQGSKRPNTINFLFQKSSILKLKNNTFLTWYRHFPRKMVGSDSRYADATHLTLRRYQVKKQSVHVNSLILRHDQMNMKLENNYHIPHLGHIEKKWGI